MKIIYPLIAACLSLQACNNAAPTASAGITAEEMVAMSLFEADTAEIVAMPAPINGAEFDGTSRDSALAPWTAVYVDDFGYTATITVPETPKSEIETGTVVDFSIDEDGGIIFHYETQPALDLPPLP